MISDKRRIREWKKGVHTDADGKLWAFENMEDNHLAATINTFPKLETAPLRKELLKRRRPAFEDAVTALEIEGRLKATTDKERKRKERAGKARKALERFLKSKI